MLSNTVFGLAVIGGVVGTVTADKLLQLVGVKIPIIEAREYSMDYFKMQAQDLCETLADPSMKIDVILFKLKELESGCAVFNELRESAEHRRYSECDTNYQGDRGFWDHLDRKCAKAESNAAEAFEITEQLRKEVSGIKSSFLKRVLSRFRLIKPMPLQHPCEDRLEFIAKSLKNMCELLHASPREKLSCESELYSLKNLFRWQKIYHENTCEAWKTYIAAPEKLVNFMFFDDCGFESRAVLTENFQDKFIEFLYLRYCFENDLPLKNEFSISALKRVKLLPKSWGTTPEALKNDGYWAEVEATLKSRVSKSEAQLTELESLIQRVAAEL